MKFVIQSTNRQSIFLLKKNINGKIIRAIIIYPPAQALKSLEQ